MAASKNTDRFEIVITEDDEGLNNLIFKNLKRHKYSCVQAFNGKQTLEVVKKEKNNILILDYKLPDLNGEEIVKALMEKNGTVPPFIVMTGYGDEKIAVEMMRLGARQYIVKEGDFINVLTEQIKLVIDDIIRQDELSKVKAQLESSKLDFQVLFKTMAEGVVYMNAKGKVISLNPAAERILGLTFDQLKGQTPMNPNWKAIDENYNELPVEKQPAMLALKTGKRIENFIYGILNPQKDDYVWILVNAVPQFKDGESKPYQVYSTFTDITQRRKAEMKLRDSEERLRVLFESAPDAIYLHDLKGKFIDGNQAAEKMLGYSKEELLGKNFTKLNLLPAKYLKKAAASLLKNVQGKEVGPEEFELIHRDGHKIPVEIRSFPVSILGRKRIMGIVRDISKRKRAEKELQKSENKFRGIFENSALGIFRSTPEGRYEEVNKSFAQILGFETPEELLKKVYDIRMLYKNSKDREKLIKEFADKGFVENYEIEANHPRKETVWITVNARQFKNADGQIYFEGTVQDITEKKIAEERLRETEQRLNALAENIPDEIFIKDEQHRFVYVNPQKAKTDGTTQEAMIGKTDFDFFAEPVAQNSFHDDEQILKTGEPVINKEEQLINANGESRWVLVTKLPRTDQFGNIIGTMGISRDITKIKQPEQQLKLNEKRLESLLRIAQKTTSSIQELLDFALREAIELTRSKIGYIYFYDEEKRRFILNTWSKEVMKECLVQDPQTLYNLDDTGCWGEAVRQRRPIIINDYEAGSPIIKGTPEGHVKLKKFLTIPVILEDKIVAVAGVANKTEDYDQTDVTQLSLLMDSVWKISERISLLNELTKAKERAEENERKLIEAQELSHVGSWEYDIEKDEVLWSEEVYRIYEFPQGQKISYEDFSQRIHPDDKQYHDNQTQRWIRKKKAEPFEYRILVPSGSQKHILVIGKVICAENGKVVKLLGSLQDITRQKVTESELIKAKEKAEESDRLKSAFLANMSHEIRTPMNGILGFANFLKEPDLTGEMRVSYIDIIQKSGKRMLDTVNDLIDISRIETGQIDLEFTDVEIDKEINNIYHFFKPEAQSKNLEFNFNRSGCKGNFVTVKTDRTKFNSIVSNLIKNAIKYTKEGRIEIECRRKNGSIEIFVKDTGIGISEKFHKDIFRRFVQVEQGYTRNYEGAGLGLSISKAYAEMLGGELWLKSEEGKGSTFYFSLPFSRKNENTHLNKTDENSVKPKRTSKMDNLIVLVAEDDEVSRYHLEILLENRTKKIYFAATGLEAIDTFKNHPEINLILMDIKMPLMDGHDTAREIRKFNKKVPIIAQTAYALAGDAEKAIEAGCDDYITKPININLLMYKISKILSVDNT